MGDMASIPQGKYRIGTNQMDGFAVDKEGPAVSIYLDSFQISTTTVTNELFKQFIDETGYITEAEKFGWSYVFHYFLSMDEKLKAQEVPGLNWWYAVEGANWKHPEGVATGIRERMNHPVVHVSRNDALAYCDWKGERLPTEAEWEVAAKGGTTNDKYPWGDNLLVNNCHQCNIWQGDFPLENSSLDGYASSAPVKTYKRNEYGLYQMIGNVWEWCLNPQGIDLSEFIEKNSQYYTEKYGRPDDGNYAIKGGSFLCHESYCKRYRISARNGNVGNSASNNTGFRTMKS